MIYEQVIIGAGAAGLYCAASKNVKNGLILERTASPGQKLLISGSGQCNLTHGGSIKAFIKHYGEHGSLLRSALYRHNNMAVMKFFDSHGLETLQRPDGKIFPKSMQAAEVLDLLLTLSKQNGYELRKKFHVTSLESLDDGTFLINGSIQALKVIIATGGCSYPSTGSDGSIFGALESLGIKTNPRIPALVPVFVQNYPYETLSGISLEAKVTIGGHTIQDDILFTHKNLSGPAILNLSRYAKTGGTLELNYCSNDLPNFQTQGNKKQADVYFSETLNLPKRLVSILLQRSGIEEKDKVSALNGSQLKAFRKRLNSDVFSISGIGGFQQAMVTKGGVSLDQINLKTFESKRFSNLFVIGEALDVDGDTGGYNLQFAFSSGYCAATT